MKNQDSAAKMAAPHTGGSRPVATESADGDGTSSLPAGGATLPQKWALFREAKRRLEHGVPVGVLIQHVTMKLRTMRGGAA